MRDIEKYRLKLPSSNSGTGDLYSATKFYYILHGRDNEFLKEDAYKSIVSNIQNKDMVERIVIENAVSLPKINLWTLRKAMEQAAIILSFTDADETISANDFKATLGPYFKIKNVDVYNRLRELDEDLGYISSTSGRGVSSWGFDHKLTKKGKDVHEKLVEMARLLIPEYYTEEKLEGLKLLVLS